MDFLSVKEIFKCFRPQIIANISAKGIFSLNTAASRKRIIRYPAPTGNISS